jgi:APA family basic amino acid/polyamine antiporter
MDRSNLVPFLPAGFGSVLSAMIPAYFSWTGFTVLIEIGGEIKDPGRNIFRALMIGFVIVLVFYIGVCLALVGTIPWYTLGNFNAPVSEAAELLLPSWLANFITLSALLASATSVNGIVLAYSRDIYAMARQRLFPEALAKLTDRHAVPARAIVTFTAVAVMFILMGGTITDYAIITVIAFMIIQIALAVAAIRIPVLMPAEYEASSFKLSVPMIRLSAGVVIVSSLGFLLKALADDPQKGLMVLLVLSSGWVWYHFRLRYLARIE